MFEIIRYVNNYVQNFEDLRYIGGKQYHAVPKSCTGVSKLPVDFESVNSANIILVLLLVKREHTDIPCLDSVQPWDQIWKSPVANHRFEIIGAMPPNRTQVQEGSHLTHSTIPVTLENMSIQRFARDVTWSCRGLFGALKISESQSTK